MFEEITAIVLDLPRHVHMVLSFILVDDLVLDFWLLLRSYDLIVMGSVRYFETYGLDYFNFCSRKNILILFSSSICMSFLIRSGNYRQQLSFTNL